MAACKGPCKDESIAPRTLKRLGRKAWGSTPTAGVLAVHRGRRGPHNAADGDAAAFECTTCSCTDPEYGTTGTPTMSRTAPHGRRCRTNAGSHPTSHTPPLCSEMQSTPGANPPVPSPVEGAIRGIRTSDRLRPAPPGPAPPGIPASGRASLRERRLKQCSVRLHPLMVAVYLLATDEKLRVGRTAHTAWNDWIRRMVCRVLHPANHRSVRTMTVRSYDLCFAHGLSGI